MIKRSTSVTAAFMTVLATVGLLAAPADARRGGSFGSRGSRTYYAPRPTYGSGYVPPVERSMTSRSATQATPGYAPAFGQQQPYRPLGSRFGGFGGGLIGGLIAGGLIGHFLGHGAGYGWGGGGGLLATLFQLAILAGIVWLVFSVFRRRTPYQDDRSLPGNSYAPSGFAASPAASPWGTATAQPQAYAGDAVDIMLDGADQDAFERLLVDVQDAFGREDYARLRQLTTPEVMSYLSEELSQNATQGLRNEVSATRLLDAEVSEAWREATGDYATIALRYEGIDVMRNRTTGAIVSGSTMTPTETTELWTFFRDAGGGPWKLSAIQES